MNRAVQDKAAAAAQQREINRIAANIPAGPSRDADAFYARHGSAMSDDARAVFEKSHGIDAKRFKAGQSGVNDPVNKALIRVFDDASREVKSVDGRDDIDRPTRDSVERYYTAAAHSDEELADGTKYRDAVVNPTFRYRVAKVQLWAKDAKRDADVEDGAEAADRFYDIQLAYPKTTMKPTEFISKFQPKVLDAVAKQVGTTVESKKARDIAAHVAVAAVNEGLDETAAAQVTAKYLEAVYKSQTDPQAIESFYFLRGMAQALGQRATLDEIRDNKSTQFSPQLAAQALKRMWDSEQNGGMFGLGDATIEGAYGGPFFVDQERKGAPPPSPPKERSLRETIRDKRIEVEDAVFSSKPVRGLMDAVGIPKP